MQIQQHNIANILKYYTRYVPRNIQHIDALNTKENSINLFVFGSQMWRILIVFHGPFRAPNNQNTVSICEQFYHMHYLVWNYTKNNAL